MQPEDKPIHFSTELLFAPFQLKPAVLQRLYYELSQFEGAGYDNVELSPPGPPRFHSRRDARTQSIALFLPDRVTLIEEWVDQPLPAFLRKVEIIAERVLDIFELESFTAQTAVVRTTFTLTGQVPDAHAFLVDKAWGQGDCLSPHFMRPVATVGLKLVLPPAENAPGEMHILIEPFRHETGSIFVEAKGIFGGLRVTRASLAPLLDNIRQTHTMASVRTRSYLEQFEGWEDES